MSIKIIKHKVSANAGRQLRRPYCMQTQMSTPQASHAMIRLSAKPLLPPISDSAVTGMYSRTPSAPIRPLLKLCSGVIGWQFKAHHVARHAVGTIPLNRCANLHDMLRLARFDKGHARANIHLDPCEDSMDLVMVGRKLLGPFALANTRTDEGT
jgi:hypothetical protein